MAWNSNSNITINKPTILIITNDWNLESTLPLPVCESTLNDMVLDVVLPMITIAAELPLTAHWSFDNTVPKVNGTGTIDSSTYAIVDTKIKLPSLSFIVDANTAYILATQLPHIQTTFSVVAVSDYTLTRTLPRPQVSATLALVATVQKQTWVLNTITDAHSRYTNYDFNSYFRLGTKQYGVCDTGIYELVGDRDFTGETNEALIDAEIILPTSTFGEQELKACCDAIVFGRCESDMEVDVILDEQYAVEGLTVVSDDRPGMHRQRVKVPKGLQGNVWGVKIRNTSGSDFSINSFELFLRTLKRLKW